jgi:predicted phosphodiesterase
MMPNVSRGLRRSAQALAEVLETGFIIFGHAHYPDALLLGNGTRYFNSGSWIPTLLEPAPGYPNAWQFTFFLLEDGTGTLLRWVPERHQPESFTVQ